MEGLDILSRSLSGQAPEAGYGSVSETAHTLTVVIQLRMRQHAGRKAMVTPGSLALGG